MGLNPALLRHTQDVEEDAEASSLDADIIRTAGRVGAI